MHGPPLLLFVVRDQEKAEGRQALAPLILPLNIWIRCHLHQHSRNCSGHVLIESHAGSSCSRDPNALPLFVHCLRPLAPLPPPPPGTTYYLPARCRPFHATAMHSIPPPENANIVNNNSTHRLHNHHRHHRRRQQNTTTIPGLKKSRAVHRRGILLRALELPGGRALRPVRAVGVHGRGDPGEPAHVDVGVRHLLPDEKRAVAPLRAETHAKILGNGQQVRASASMSSSVRKFVKLLHA